MIKLSKIEKDERIAVWHIALIVEAVNHGYAPPIGKHRGRFAVYDLNIAIDYLVGNFPKEFELV